MRRVIVGRGLAEKVDQLKRHGATLPRFEIALARLAAGQQLGADFKDHALRGRLRGLRSCVVGRARDGETIVLLYKATARLVVAIDAGPHDAVYQEQLQSRR